MCATLLHKQGAKSWTSSRVTIFAPFHVIDDADFFDVATLYNVLCIYNTLKP